MIQADVTKEMAFKEGGEVGNMGPKKLILILRVQSNTTGAQTGVSSNRLTLSWLTTNKSDTSFNGIRSAEAASTFSGRFL